MDEMDRLKPSWRGRRFHVKRVQKPISEVPQEAFMRFMDEQCAEGWEPIGTFQVGSDYIIFFTHYCTVPRKECVLCIAEAEQANK